MNLNRLAARRLRQKVENSTIQSFCTKMLMFITVRQVWCTNCCPRNLSLLDSLTSSLFLAGVSHLSFSVSSSLSFDLTLAKLILTQSCSSWGLSISVSSLFSDANSSLRLLTSLQISSILALKDTSLCTGDGGTSVRLVLIAVSFESLLSFFLGLSAGSKSDLFEPLSSFLSVDWVYFEVTTSLLTFLSFSLSSS